VLQRSTYGQELDSAVGFARVNDPDFTRDAASFARAFDAVDYTFQLVYVDDRDISYFKSGLLPVRAPGVSYDLPRFGDPAYDWRGFVPFPRKPQQTNPSQGYITSWNNKQAPGFSAADNQWGYGPVYRSQLLDRRILQRIRSGQRISRVGLVDAMQDAATADLRGEQLLPLLLDVSATTRRRPRPWPCCALGPQRHPPGRPGPRRRVRRPGRDRAVRRVVGGQRRLVGRQGGPARHARDLTDQLPQKIDDHPRLGSARPGTASPGTATSTRTCARCSAAGDGAVLPHLLRRRRPRDLSQPAARVAGRGDGSGAGGAGGQRRVCADLRQERGFHPLRHRRSGRGAADRLAEPADVPAGGGLLDPPPARGALRHRPDLRRPWPEVSCRRRVPGCRPSVRCSCSWSSVCCGFGGLTRLTR
jgi:hypothetical protein